MANWLTKRFSYWKASFQHRVRAVMGITISAFTLLLILRDVILDPKYRDWFLLKYIPNLPWYWWALIGLTALFLLALEGAYAVQRDEHLKLLKRHKARIREIKEKYKTDQIHAHTKQLVAATHISQQSTEITPPIKQPLLEEKPTQEIAKEDKAIEIDASLTEQRIECIRTYTAPTRYTKEDTAEGEAAVLYEVEEVGGRWPNTVIAEFVNSPNAKGWVTPIPSLRAQITFYDAQGNYCHRVSHCAWLKEPSEYIELEAGDRAGLAIALLLEAGQINSIENYNERGLYEKKPPAKLDGKSFRVRVLLTGGRFDLIEEEFIFDLTCETDFSLTRVDS
jgi:hypothetical protein